MTRSGRCAFGRPVRLVVVPNRREADCAGIVPVSTCMVRSCPEMSRTVGWAARALGATGVAGPLVAPRTPSSTSRNATAVG